MTENKHWRSQVKLVHGINLEQLEKGINEFCKDKFVVGIQYPEAFQVEQSWTAVISFKILGE